MKEKIKKILTVINSWKVILLIILIGIGLFYWYQIRPSMIYSKCYKETMEKMEKVAEKGIKTGWSLDIKEIVELYNFYYKQCLQLNGINK
jgi:preprotein translocase subunit YajC